MNGRLTSVVALLCLAALGTPAVAAASADGDERAAALEEGRALTQAFLAGETDALWDRFGEQLRSAVGSSDGLAGFRRQVEEQLGTEEAVVREEVGRQGEVTVYQRISRWSRSPQPVAFTWALAPDGGIVGFQVTPAAPVDVAGAGEHAPLPAGRLPDGDAVAGMVESFIAQGGAPAVVVGVVDAGGRRYTARGDAGDGRAPDADTVFAMGSVTKGLTGLLLASMAADDVVALDQPVGDLAPEKLDLPPAIASITLEELATHRAGLPRLASGPEMQARLRGSDPYAGSTPAEIFADLARVAPQAVADARGRYAYSNFGMALLGQLLARAADKPYGELLAQRVFAPLGLPAPVLDPDRVQRRRAQGTAAGKPVPAWHMDAYAPAGAWQASAAEALDLAQKLLGDGPAWVQEALERRAGEEGEAGAVGLGWHHARVGDREVVWHNGMTAGFSSYLGLVPAEGLAVVVLANGSGGVDALAAALLDPHR